MHPQRPRCVSASTLLSYASLLLLVTLVSGSFLLPGCFREQTTAFIDRNQPPETFLVQVPGDSSTAFYRIHLYWNGVDPDGETVAYEWAITDSLPPETIVYQRTVRTDSTFVFPVEETRQVLGHRFYVRAIDNEGKPDPTPAWTFFTARNNCAPQTWFTRAVAMGPNGERHPITSTDLLSPTDTIPSGWSVSFAWTGADCDSALEVDGTAIVVGKVAGFSHKLSPLESGFIGDSPADTSALYAADRLASNIYVMYARARDDGGLSAQDPTVKSFVWNEDPVTRFTQISENPADSSKVFYVSFTGVNDPNNPDLSRFTAYTPGDTLPLTSGGVVVAAGLRARDPDAPYQITGYQARLVKKDESGWYTPVDPQTRIFVDPAARYTGDYYLMGRAQDGLERWDGTPDTIRFSVNFPPRWIGRWTARVGSAVDTLSAWPYAGAVYTLPPGASFVPGDTLLIRFAAYNPDADPVLDKGLQFQARIASYPVTGGGRSGDALYPYLPDTEGGEVLETTFEGNPPNGHWWQEGIGRQDHGHLVPGEYLLSLQVKEAVDVQTSDRGYRRNEILIPFTIVASH
jgi:hypothetical protein